MATAGNRSLITTLRLVFREVDRVHDVNGSRVLAPDGHVHHRDFATAIASKTSTWHRLGDPGAPPDEALETAYDIAPRSGLYRVIADDTGHNVLRTVLPENSGPVGGGKCITVWSVPSLVDGANVKIPRGDAVLLHELVFQGGRFRHVPGTQAGRDVRDPHGPEHDALLLDIVGLRGAGPEPRQESRVIYALLHPMQVPWLALQELAGDVRRRGTCLFDPLHVRLLPKGDPAQAVPLLPLPELAASPTFEMHLVDPFKEALLRNAEYVRALELWMAEQARIGDDPLTALALGIESLTTAAQRHEELDAFAFDTHLRDRRAQSRRLCWIANELAADCVRWIGREHRRTTTTVIPGLTARSPKPFAYWDVAGTSGRIHDDPLPPGQPDNPFSRAAQDSYLHGCTPEQYYDLGAVIGAATQRLGESTVGNEFLRENFGRCRDGAALVADGGLGYVFREMKKVSEALKPNPWVKGGVAMAAVWYGDAWVAAKHQDALQDVQTFFEARHGVRFKVEGNRSARRARLSELRSELRAARRAGRDKLPIPGLVPPPQHSFAENAELAMVPLQFLAESINVAVSVHALTQSGTATDLAEAGNAALNAYDGLAKLRGRKMYGTRDIAALRKYGLKISPIGVVTGVIDVGLEVSRWDSATNQQKSVGHALSTVGTLVSLAGGATSSVGVGVIAVGAGLILSQLGSWVVEIGDDCRRFLRACRWGKPDLWETIADGVVDAMGERAFWLEGDISTLRDDVLRQRRCVQRLTWHYTPRIVVIPQIRERLFLELRGFNPSLVAALETLAPRWEVDVTVTPDCPLVSFDTPKPVFETLTLKHADSDLPVIDASDEAGPCLLVPLGGGDADALVAKLRERPVQGNWHAVRSLAFAGRVRIHVPAAGNSLAVVLERRVENEVDVGAGG